MSEVYCADCQFYDDKGLCSNPGGLFHGIRISAAVAASAHDCKTFEEASYILSEVGHLDFALKGEGINLSSGKVKRICDRFFKSMIDAEAVKVKEFNGLIYNGKVYEIVETVECSCDECAAQEMCVGNLFPCAELMLPKGKHGIFRYSPELTEKLNKK